MKILVCARHFGYLRNFESALIELADRGHALHLTADRRELTGGLQMVERLAARYPGVTVGWTPRREKDDEWLDVATKIRLSQDYLRFLAREYDRAPQLRRRAKERTPAMTVRLVERMGFRIRLGRALLGGLLGAFENAVPRHVPYDDFMRQAAPDVVLLTPLIDLGSPQLDLLKSARALGLRTALCVGSWDHLSSKALIRIQPDLVTVWNGVQRREAIEMHQVPVDRVVVTGAQCFDQWFDRKPSRSREEFCRAMGLPVDRRFALYVCSSLFRGGAPEAEFTIEWVKAIRASTDPRLRDLGILVRPHPGRMDEWTGHDVASLGVAFHGGNPIDAESRDDYFDALQRGGRRPEYERVSRGRDRRQAGAGCAAAPVLEESGRDAPLPLPAYRRRRAAPHVAVDRGASAAAWARRGGRGRAQQCPVRPGVHPALRAGSAVHTAVRRCHRSAWRPVRATSVPAVARGQTRGAGPAECAGRSAEPRLVAAGPQGPQTRRSKGP
jgi:hypothetical protein